MTATIDEVRQELEDLAAWRSGLSDAVDTILGISSPRLSTDGRGSSNGMALPFHLSAVVDEPDLGGAGVRTEAGLLDLLGSWSRSIAHDRGEHVKGSPITYLHTTLAWAQEHADWEGLAGDVKDAWVAVGRIVGHADVTLGECPICGGRIITTPRNPRRDKPQHGGIPEYGVCDTCDHWYNDSDDIARVRAEELRSVAVKPTIAVTLTTALRLWPEITKDQIKKWTKRGKLTRCLDSPPTYRLRTINMLATQLTTRRRDAA